MGDIEWRDIPGYEGRYQVSNVGDVRSLWMWSGNHYKAREHPYPIAQHPTTTGYRMVPLSYDGNIKHCKVHRLVAMAFIPNPDDKPYINHKDGNPLNNHVENLEWCTQKENVDHALRIGLKRLSTISKEELADCVKRRMRKCEIAKKYHMTQKRLNEYYRAYGICDMSEKYYIDKKEFMQCVNQGMSNTQMADKFNCPRSLIGRMKYKMKKGDYI